MALNERRPLLFVGLWTAGALVATSTGLLAVRLVDDQVGAPVVPPQAAAASTAAPADPAPAAPLTPEFLPEEEPLVIVETIPGAPAAGQPATQAGSGPAPAAAPAPPPPPAAVAPELPLESPVAPAPAAAPVDASEPSAVPAPSTTTFSNQGGTIGVDCEGTHPVLVYATPNEGYRVERADVDEDVLDVRFESDRDRARLDVRCLTGTPTLDDDD